MFKWLILNLKIIKMVLLKYPKIKIIALVLVALYFSACDQTPENNFDFEIVRYDKLIFNLDIDNIKSEFESIKNEYPNFTDIYFEKILGTPGYNTNDSLFYEELTLFISDTAMIHLYELSAKKFGEMDDLKSEFGSAFEIAKKLFPDFQTPKLYSYISGFTLQRFVFEDTESDGLGFGMDLFLGDKFPYYRLENQQNTFSNYLVRTYNKEHLVKKTLEMWIEDKLGPVNGSRAIDYMINNGKKYFIIKNLMPELQDSVLLDYTSDQIEWLGNNEKQMWTYFIKNDFFYTTDSYKVKRLTSPGPNSQALGMPQSSPGYTGNYLGYRIVETYVKRQNEFDMSDIFKINDPQKILELSKFKPRRN